MKDKFVIDERQLFWLDQDFDIEDTLPLEMEIGSILNNLWSGSGEYEEILKPLYFHYFQSRYLPKLYSYYFSLKNILKNKLVYISNSNMILDLVAVELGLEMNPERYDHSEEFLFTLYSSFNERKLFFGKKSLRRIYRYLIRNFSCLKGVQVIYLNAGKLKGDLSRIPHGMSALNIPLNNNLELDIDVNVVMDIVHANINKLKLSIPKNMIHQLIDNTIGSQLPLVIDRIYSYVKFIKKEGVELVIISSPSHADHICLWAAARVAKCPIMLIPHGFQVGRYNSSLENLIDYQCVLHNFEFTYSGAKMYNLRMEWFDERKI